jgi:hypothetical protein
VDLADLSRVRTVLIVIALAALAACSGGGSGSTSRSTGSTPADSSAVSSPTSASSSTITVSTDDPCSLLSAEDATAVVGGSSFTQVSIPYDVALALANLDRVNNTSIAEGFQGHATTCANAADPSGDPQTFVSVTLFTDTGPVNSFTALGYGQSAQYDLTNSVGVKAESNPNNKFVAAVLDEDQWILVHAKKDGTSSVELAVAAIRRVLDHLR